MSGGLVWIDLETTGSDETQDCLLEVGMILTDWDFNQVYEGNWVVWPTPLGLGRLMQNDIVRDMHTKNGLLEECRMPIMPSSTPFPEATAMGHTVAPGHVDNYLPSIIRDQFQKDGRFTLAGSGVGHFDRRFIDVWLPQLSRILTYYPLDMGNVRRFLRTVNADWRELTKESAQTDDKPHRALDDIRLHLEEAKRYKEVLQKLVPETTRPL